MANTANVQIMPMIAYFGKDTAQVETITTVADVASSLNNKYFMLHTPAGAKYYVWMNVNSAGTDPAIAGATEVEIAIPTASTAAAVATAIQTALDALTPFIATVSQNVVSITHSTIGPVQGAHDGITTGFTFDISVMGDMKEELGHLDGEIEVSGLAATTIDLTAHATGTTVLEQRVTGFEQAEVTLNLKETDIAKIRKIFTKTGKTYTPAGANATEVIGFGTKVSCNAVASGAPLVLEPKCKPAVNPNSKNHNFPNALPILDSITFSGENFFVIPVTFRVLADQSLPENINRFFIGDGSQVF